MLKVMVEPITSAGQKAIVPRTPVSLAALRVTRVAPPLPISDAHVVAVADGDVAITTRVPLQVGDRLSLHAPSDLPPVLLEVTKVDPTDPDEACRAHCRCLLGSLEDVA